MMKLKATAGDRQIIVLGLSHANLDRLREQGLRGKIVVDGAEMGLDADIWITAAPTESAMMDAFGSAIGPDTKVHIDRRFKS